MPNAPPSVSPTEPRLIVRESLTTIGVMAVLVYGIYDDDLRLLDVLGDDAPVVELTTSRMYTANARAVYHRIPPTQRFNPREWQNRGYMPQAR